MDVEESTLVLTDQGRRQLAHVARQTDQIDAVMSDFLDTVSEQSGLAIGASDYVKKVLSSALGEQKATSVMEKILGGSVGGLDKLKWMDSRAVADFMVSEHPQIQAIVLSYLEPDQAAEVLQLMPDDATRSDIVMRVANLQSIPPSALQELSAVLEAQLTKQPPSRFAQLGGKRTAAEIMNNLDNSLEEAVMEGIRGTNEGLGDEIQELMFVFENLREVDDRGIDGIFKSDELPVFRRSCHVDRIACFAQPQGELFAQARFVFDDQ